MHTNPRISRCLKAGAAALLAASVLLASVAPSSATMWSQRDESRAAQPTSFHHHFFRGVSRSQAAADRAAESDLLAVSDAEVATTDEAVSYCADHFESYDPSTGMYLGYDGNEHACP